MNTDPVVLAALRKSSPTRRMQRQAFLLMRRHKGGAPKVVAPYASLCHEIGLLLRAHGLAQTVSVLSLDGDAKTFLDDFCRVVHAGDAAAALPVQRTSPDLDGWRRCLTGDAPPNQALSMPQYVVQARLALQAADAMKNLAESVLGIDRAEVEAPFGAGEAAEVPHA